MKKLFLIVLGIILILSFSLSISSESTSESITVFRNLVDLEVNGKKVNVDNFLYDGVTYIPLRRVSELLNKNVGWNRYTNVASIDDPHYEIEALSKLLPESKGFEWNYDGFAEYGHTMKIDSIVDGNTKRDYNISGQVSDPSDGESNISRNLSIKYTISDNRLVQRKTEMAMLDSKFDKITLIQTPLVAGTYWEEKLVDQDGASTTLNSFIQKVEVSNDGKKEYTVRYDDVNSAYYEIRKIKEGIGVVNFEKLLELEDSSFPVSYFLFKSDDSSQKKTKINAKLYFPDTNGDKLHLEQRTLDVVGMAVARASITALIDGPNTNLNPPIPTGTRLLNIYIQNGICFVDFSEEFIANHSGGSSGELMTLYSITNTLTEYPTVKGVQILVEGQSGRTLGNIILDRPLNRNTSLIY